MIQIKYDGAYPNLCRGNLEVTIRDKVWIFPLYALRSGGDATFDEDGTEIVTEGSWSIYEWPEGFPKNMKRKVLRAVNKEIPLGCCGGCI